LYFEDFKVGDLYTCEPILITAEEIHNFAMKYDPAPIHVDPEYAENHSIFNGIISSGFLTISAMWGQWIRSNVFGNEFIVGKNFDYVNFTTPVRANDVLTTEVEIVGIRASSNPNRGEVTLKFTVKNQDGVVVALVQSKALLKTKASISTQKSSIS
jgi:acyl dehydratase